MDRPQMQVWWQIERLVTRYARACDERDWESYRGVFTDDALIDYTGAYGRRGTVGEILPWISALMTRAALPVTQHLLANFDMREQSGTVSGRVDYLNPDVFLESGERRGVINGGTYSFNARRSGDEWRLFMLEATIHWSGRIELCSLDARE